MLKLKLNENQVLLSMFALINKVKFFPFHFNKAVL